MSDKKTEKVQILRTCDKDLKSYHGFQWPKKGHVEAPDFNPNPTCGYGLHGLVDGEGDWSLLDWSADAKALICEVDGGALIQLGGKVKFKSAIVKKVVTLAAAIGELFCSAHRLNKQVADLMEASKGTKDVETASGYNSKQAASGEGSKQAASGNYSTQAASGNYSKQAASGEGSVSMAVGLRASVKSGKNGAFALTWNDGKRPRIVVGYVGEDGIKADQWYGVSSAGKIVEVSL